ncbi:uncharacterized protein TNCV_502251 [Trichonephila clavipes]|nr:uncharacterized protein TNCV_502251 [Trichonephila clavipes]
MTLHSSTKNSLAVLNHKISEANSQVQNVKLGGHQTCLSINRLWHELCDILCRLVGTTAPGHHDCSIQECKNFTPNAAVLFVDVAIQPEVRFIAKQNSLMKIGNNGNLVLGPFDESTPCLMIVLMNCQTKLRINHLTAVKSVAILETWAVGSLVVRASDSRPEDLSSMPPNTHRVHTEYVLVKSVGPKSYGLSHELRDWRIFPSPSVHAEIVEVEIGGVAIYRPLGNFRRAKSYCHLYGAQGQRQAYF